VPDKIIGFSIGELGCAYADGCFNVEQIILSAYSRGLESIETKITNNSSMSTVDLGYENIKDRYSSDIKMSCHNVADSIIIRPAKSMNEFVAQLQVRLTHISFLSRKSSKLY